MKDDSKSTLKPKAQENGLTLSIRVIESKLIATCRRRVVKSLSPAVPRIFSAPAEFGEL